MKKLIYLNYLNYILLNSYLLNYQKIFLFLNYWILSFLKYFFLITINFWYCFIFKFSLNFIDDLMLLEGINDIVLKLRIQLKLKSVSGIYLLMFSSLKIFFSFFIKNDIFMRYCGFIIFIYFLSFIFFINFL